MTQSPQSGTGVVTCRSCGSTERSADALTVQLCVSELELYGKAKVPFDCDDAAAAGRGSGGGGGIASGRGYTRGDDY